MESKMIYKECTAYASYIVDYICNFLQAYPVIYNIYNFIDTYLIEIMCIIIYSNLITLFTMAVCFSIDNKQYNNKIVKPVTKPQVVPQYANASTQYEFDDIDGLIIEIKNIYSKNPKRIVTLTTRATHKVVTHNDDDVY